MSDSDKADAQYDAMEFLQDYWRFLKSAFLMSPFLVAAWVYFQGFLAGAPEPEWWLALERALGITW